jgi:hypothetical protein
MFNHSFIVTLPPPWEVTSRHIHWRWVQLTCYELHVILASSVLNVIHLFFNLICRFCHRLLRPSTFPPTPPVAGQLLPHHSTNCCSQPLLRLAQLPVSTACNPNSGSHCRRIASSVPPLRPSTIASFFSASHQILVQQHRIRHGRGSHDRRT